MGTTLILNYFNPNPHVIAYFFAFAAHLSLLGVGIIERYFRRRFRMSTDLFIHIANYVKRHDRFFD